MKKNNLQNELFAQGLIEEGNSAKIDAFKKAYKTDYDQNYNKNYKAKTQRTRLTFSDEEMSYLKDLAKSYNLPLATMLKASIFAYHKATYIHIDTSQFTTIEKTLNEMNRRIAESIQYIHLSKNISVADIQSLKMDIAELEKLMSTTLRNPPRLEDWIKEHCKNDAMFLPKLLQAIAYYLNP